MINLLEDFVNSSRKVIMVGGMVGTEIERYAIEAALRTTGFKNVLILNGCQDYIGLMKKNLPNVIYWGDLFYEEPIDSSIPYDPWKPKCMNPVQEYGEFIDYRILVKYDFMVILNSHLIEPLTIDKIIRNFGGQIIMVCDPFEKMVYEYASITSQGDIPIICDTLRKVSPMIALARAVYEQKSRGIDTRVAGAFTEIKRFHKKNIINKTVNFRQYVTTDPELYHDMVEEQKSIPVRKNQTFMVIKDIVDLNLDDSGSRNNSLTKKSMIIAQDIETEPLKKFRIYNSKKIYFCDITYDTSPRTYRYLIPVIPANLIMLEDVMYHRFKQMTVIADHPLTRAERYTLFKNSNNVSIVDKKNMKGVV